MRRRAVLPVLCAMLLYAYASWVGLPSLLLPALGRPPPYPPASSLAHLHPTLAVWLGLQGAGPLLLWTLFAAALACVMQVCRGGGAGWGLAKYG